MAVYPIQYLAALPMRIGDGIAESFKARESLIEDNRRLHEENLMLRSHTAKFSAIERENERLRKLLDSTMERREEVVVADTISIEPNASSRQIVINRGARQGVYEGQPVADAFGILGQVVQVGPFTSTVLLISDPRHALPVQINRSGVRAVASGEGEGDELVLSFVPTNADIKVGDLVVCSGLGHQFPAGYPVGEVKSIDAEPGEPFAKIIVAPSAHLGRSREVLLVWPHPHSAAAEAPQQ